jgi:hypothetical protein
LRHDEHLMRDHLLFYVSGHGFGHARRTAAVIEHLLRSRPRAEVSVRTAAPARIFTAVGVGARQISPTSLDSGVVEHDALNIDVPATVRRVRELLAKRQELVEHEVAALRPQPPALVVADIPFLAGPIARRLRAPCVAVGNFTWDWIYEPLLSDSPDGRGALRTIADDYATMAAVLRLPLSHGMPQFRRVIDVPAAAHRTRQPEAVILNRCGFDPEDHQPRVLIGMRGGTSPEAILEGCRTIPDVLFTTLEPLAGHGCANLRYVAQHEAGLDFADLLAVHDVVISKFGYGVVCDASAAGSRLLWPPRHGFREEEIFEVEAPRFLPTQRIPREDYAAGRWGPWIERLLALPRPKTPPLDGEEAVVRQLLSFTE